jgi:hypothetical protein
LEHYRKDVAMGGGYIMPVLGNIEKGRARQSLRADCFIVYW